MDIFVSKIAGFIVTPLIIFGMYMICIELGENISFLVGFQTASIYQLIATIYISSCITFLVTLIINYIWQLISFLNNKGFIRTYHGVHLSFLYVSGLITVLAVLEPLMIKDGLIDSPIEKNILSAFVLVFLVMLTNYSIYNSIVINNDFKVAIFRGDSQQFSLKFVYGCFSIILSSIMINYRSFYLF